MRSSRPHICNCSLGRNVIGPEGAAMLAEALTENTAVTTLE